MEALNNESDDLRNVVSQVPTPCRGGFAQISPGVRLKYHEYGSLTALNKVLFIMGFNMSKENWENLVQELLTLHEEDLHLVTFDNRGIGGSHFTSDKDGREANSEPRFTTRQLGGDTLDLMSHLGWEAAHIVGVSMGGMVAMELAAQEPLRVQSLTLMVTTPSFGSLLRGVPYDVRAAASLITARFRSPEQRLDDTIGNLYPTAYLEAPSAKAPGFSNRAYIKARLSYVFGKVGLAPPDISKKQFLAIMTHAMSEERLHLLRDADFPKLIIGARHDRLIHVGSSLRLHAMLTSERTYFALFEDGGKS